jgi:hypothetical protein
MGRLKNIIKRGDTIIEVTFAIAVFSLISVLSLQIMDRDVAMIQGTLEAEMARNEIDAQAEALRFIQNSYLSERELANRADLRQYQALWLKLSRDPTATIKGAGTGLANEPAEISDYSSVACRTYYENNKTTTGDTHRIYDDKAFVINTRKINPKEVDETIIQAGTTPVGSLFREADLYPRIIYTGGSAAGTLSTDDSALTEVFPTGQASPTGYMQSSAAKIYDKVASVEGIWVISAKAKTRGSASRPEFYDFHIRTCWFAPGHDRPSTIATTIRLYNPEYVEDQR